MLIACASCHRQYDVGDQEAGARVRCFCGHLNSVPAHRPRQVKMQHCSNCGGAIAGEGLECEYCDAKITLGDRGWGQTCPECMARMVKGAKFCGGCGVAIEVQAALRPLANQACPRCKETLQLCERVDVALTECTACGGVWLSDAVFKRMLEKRQRLAVADLLPLEGQATDAELPPLPKHPVQYLPCPECAELMNRKNFADSSGIMIDWCRGHGYWFDLHELEHIERFVAEGGLERARARRAERDERSAQRDKGTRERSLKRIKLGGSRGRSSDPIGGGLFIAGLVEVVLAAIFG